MTALDAFRDYREPAYLYRSIAAAIRHLRFWCGKLGIDMDAALAWVRAEWERADREMGVAGQ